MAKVIAGMTTSLDGFVADGTGSVDRLYPDLEWLHGTAYMREMIESTGAVQAPIFVLTHRPPPRVAPKQDEHLTFTFVTDGVGSAVAKAKAAAGDKAVQVIGGASVVRQLLLAGLVDELHVDVMPVLLGAGLRLFEDQGVAGMQPERISVLEVGARTSLRFRVPR
ncbi:MAG TPA: dihydrofolate reductase family protein [Candidatus Limnocylindria bacterium]|jgi:dihydrofolate reductase|nr:dihydrofolate reductase family protein [Candidatus Limnocylindria bacterium]